MLQVCDLATPPNPVAGRSFEDAFKLNPDVVDQLASMLDKAIENYSH